MRGARSVRADAATGTGVINPRRRFASASETPRQCRALRPSCESSNIKSSPASLSVIWVARSLTVCAAFWTPEVAASVFETSYSVVSSA